MPDRDLESQKFLKALGLRLRQLRIERGLSQEELAAQSGFSRSYYTEVETGKRNVAILNLYRLAKCLKVPIQELLDLKHEQTLL
jgi:transcriptional regulator with XRE-family HTH domain